MNTNEPEMTIQNSLDRTVTGQSKGIDASTGAGGTRRVNSPKATRALSKDHADYWRGRVQHRTCTDREGNKFTTPELQVRLFHAGRESWFNLATANKANAAVKARDIYKHLIDHGWDATLAKFKPKGENRESMTISEFADFFREALKRVEHPPSKPSAERYVKSFNFICRRVGVKQIADLTVDKVKVFVGKYLAEGRAEGRNEDSVKISCNATLRYAGALFSRQMLDAYREAGTVLANPFAGHKLRRVKIEAYSPLRTEMLDSIWREAVLLRDGDPQAPARAPRQPGQPEQRWGEPDWRKSHPEAYTILLLELGLGLRRNEADKAQWDWFYTEAGGRHYLEVKATPYFTPKSKQSRIIPVEKVLYDAIHSTRREVSPFVVPGRQPKEYTPETAPKNIVYRCDLHHRVLTAWLRKRGIDDEKPCHLLRKEFGSYVATSFGLFHAQRFLGHSSPIVTEQYYAGLTKMPELNHAKITPMPDAREKTA